MLVCTAYHAERPLGQMITPAAPDTAGILIGVALGLVPLVVTGIIAKQSQNIPVAVVAGFGTSLGVTLLGDRLSR